jgi:signal transduction histidine kinase
MLGDVEPRLASTLKDMERSGKNLHAMIEDLLDVYRLEMGLVQVRRNECDVSSFLDGCFRDRQLEADETTSPSRSGFRGNCRRLSLTQNSFHGSSRI